jgi:hypothetical protein
MVEAGRMGEAGGDVGAIATTDDRGSMVATPRRLLLLVVMLLLRGSPPGAPRVRAIA